MTPPESNASEISGEPSAWPLVTVIPLRPARGGDESRLVRSLKEQTMPRWVIADGPGEAVDSMPGRLNGMVMSARTDLVAFASPDAVLSPTFLEKCFWFLATHPRYAFVNSYERRTDAQGLERESTIAFFDADSIQRSHEIGLHAVVRRAVWLEVGGIDESLPIGLAAWEFWLRSAEAGHWGSTVAERLVCRPGGPDHGDATADQVAPLMASAARRFAVLRSGHPPVIEPRWPNAFDPVRVDPPAMWACPGAPRGETSPDRRHLLMLVPWLRMGGADKFNLDLCRMLRERGWSLSIACSAPGRDDWRDLFEGLTSDIVMPHTFLHWSDYPPLLRSLIETRRPGVVLVSNSELAYSLVPYFRAFCPEPVYLDYVHMEEEDWKSGGHARHSAGVCDQLDMTLTTSEHLRSWLVARGAQPDRVRCLPIGVDHRSWVFDAAARDRARALLGVAPGTTVILHAGRVCEQKQPRVLGRTLRELANRGRRFVAMVAGEGEDLPWLRRYVEEHGLEGHVRLLGAQSPDQVRELMAASDIFFLPSKWEGVALVLYEAMASGVVFVGTRVGGQGEVAGADEAVLVAIEDQESDQALAERFAREIESLMDDPGRCERLKIAARARVESLYTHDRLVGGFLGAVAEARRLQRAGARQRLTPGLAREIAVRAIEMVRLEWQVGRLWLERQGARSATAGSDVAGGAAASGGGSPRTTRAAVRRMLLALRSVAGGRSGPA